MAHYYVFLVIWGNQDAWILKFNSLIIALGPTPIFLWGLLQYLINQQFTELFISANHIHLWESQHPHLYPAAECGNSSPAFPLCVWKWCWKARVHPRTRLQLMLVITSCQSHLISGMNSTISTARGRKREGKHNSFYWHLLHIFVVVTCSYSPHTRLSPGPNCPFLLVPFLAQIV